ncbi:ATP phosphoribosyltransferase regulatory subunit [Croceicoccus sp. F390]|uniref:ATP phosphoribosyltransferase regulatory subunit n=1 Tax=Croceicoccus esteveae TaxID=3075597 RepID=A0ABU2ZHT7_9SPHN|nr:ATP phosphoribosyltransferase regulatory subunit [Croceicoccus sp. F390]MDT0576173.1 ATP phosphoribosyltransferase regulatory subunit [Croceicoccus sp. F390]
MTSIISRDADPDLLPEGLSDRLPAEAAAAGQVTRAMVDTMVSHGYAPVQPPLVEFERSLASRMEGTDRRQLVRYTDPASLRMLAMRSDMTVQIGRMAATVLQDAPRPLRLCYAGQVLTLRGNGVEPERERLQVGAEIIGADTAAAATESVRVAVAAIKAAGAREVSVDFTLPDLVDTLAAGSLPLKGNDVAAVRRELDAKDAGGLKSLGAHAYLPLLYATGPFDTAIEDLARIDAGGALASRIAGLRRIAAALGDEARLTLDPSERHGFEYQSWFGFTLYAGGLRNALGRGGTYRIGSENGHDEAATGFSLYPDPLIRAAAGVMPANRLFLPEGHDSDAAARLRAIGWQTVAALGEADDPAALGCTHVLRGREPQPL